MYQECMLTTTDNPYNPFTNFSEWYSCDEWLARMENRPTCCAYLARISMVGEDISDQEYCQVMNDAIDEIVKLNLNGKFKKITAEEAESLVG